MHLPLLQPHDRAGWVSAQAVNNIFVMFHTLICPPGIMPWSRVDRVHKLLGKSL